MRPARRHPAPQAAQDAVPRFVAASSTRGPTPFLAGPADVFVLQRLAGNGAVSEVLARPRREGTDDDERSKSRAAGDEKEGRDAGGAGVHHTDTGEHTPEKPDAKRGRSAESSRRPAKPVAPRPVTKRPPLAPLPRLSMKPPARPGPVASETKAKLAVAQAKEEEASATLQTALGAVETAIDQVGEVERPAKSTEGGKQLLDALLDGDRQGRAKLAEASRQGAAEIVEGTAQEVGRVKEAGSTTRATVGAAAATTRSRVGEVTANGRQQVEGAAGSATARIGAWQQEAQAQMGGAVDQGVAQIKSAADQQATAVRAAATSGSQAVAQEAAKGAQQANKPGGGGGEVGQARAAVAKKVGGDASSKFRKEGERASADLLRQGSEAAAEVSKGGQDAAQALDAGRAEAATGIDVTTAVARQRTAQVGQKGTAALAQHAQQANQQVGEVAAEATQQLAAASAAHAARMQETGATAARGLATKVTEVAKAAKEGIDKQAKKVALSKVSPAEAGSGASQLQSRLGGLYGEAGERAVQHGQQTRGHLGEAAVASTSALDQASSTVGQHLTEGAATHAASATQLASATASAADQAAAVTTSTGAAAVGRAAAKVGGGASAAVDAVNQAGSAGTEHAAGKAQEAGGKATEGVADAHAKVAEGQSRVDNAYSQRQQAQAPVQRLVVQRGVWSWLKGQWNDFVNMITDPAFLIGLGVTLILLPFLGPGALIVGGAVGGAVGGIQRNIHEGKDWYDWKNIVVGALEGAVVGAIFAVAGVALVYFNVGLLLGALAMGALSAGIGVVLNFIHGQPLDKGLLANFFLAAIFHMVGEFIRGRAGPKAVPPERPGAGYGAIDPKATPEGFTFRDTVNTKGVADVTIRTEVTTAEGKTGYAERGYFRMGNRLVLMEVDLSKIPSEQRWVRPSPEAEPVRLESYMTMRQMKLMEAEMGNPDMFAGARTVQMRNVVNIDTVFQLARAAKTGASHAEALRTSRSVTYAERSIAASGGRIKSVTESGGQTGKASQAKNPAKMAEYGLAPDDPVRFGMTIEIEVEPVPTPEPAPKSTKSGVPAVPGARRDED